ncbi:AsmA family protein [Klebsiella michiganensis]|nr:AsmA family protein [Klebsiella michiganensis]
MKNRSWGVWSGSATLNAAAATFNRIDVRRPSLKLSANASTVNVNELSAFTERGILQATAAVSQLPAAPGQPEPERSRRAAEYFAGLGMARAAGFRRR